MSSTYKKEDQGRKNTHSLHPSLPGNDFLKKQFGIELNNALMSMSASSEKLVTDSLIYKEGDLILLTSTTVLLSVEES